MDVGDSQKKEGNNWEEENKSLCAHKIRKAEERKWGKIVGGLPSH